MGDQTDQSKFIQSICEAMHEILGAAEANLILYSFCEDHGNTNSTASVDFFQLISGLGNEFAIRYQPNTAKGLLIRIGDASFDILRRDGGEISELGSIENRLKPMLARFEFTYKLLVEKLSTFTGVLIHGSQKGRNTFCMQISAPAEKSFTSDLHLYLFGGILRAFGQWIDSRKEYQLRFNDENELQLGENTVCLEIVESIA